MKWLQLMSKLYTGKCHFTENHALSLYELCPHLQRWMRLRVKGKLNLKPGGQKIAHKKSNLLFIYSVGVCFYSSDILSWVFLSHKMSVFCVQVAPFVSWHAVKFKNINIQNLVSSTKFVLMHQWSMEGCKNSQTGILLGCFLCM